MIPTNEDGSPAREMTLVEVPNPNLLGRAYRGPKTLLVLCNREHGEWHISVSAVGRYPTWDELRDVAWVLKPDVQFKVVVPTKGKPYLNVHEHCIHLWQDVVT